MRERDLLVVVPARGGSKGLPGKNVRMLGDMPLLGWTAAALRSGGLKEDPLCVLSTDDPEIAAVGREVGLDVPFLRPAELSGDDASTASVVHHVLDWTSQNLDTTFRAIMLLQPTSPFRPPASLREAMEVFTDSRVDAVIGAKAIHRTLATLFHADGEHFLAPIADASTSARRQDIRPLLTPNGALYVVRTDVFRRESSFFPNRTRAIVMDAIASVDIDDATDWSVAEALVAVGNTWRGRIDVNSAGALSKR